MKVKEKCPGCDGKILIPEDVIINQVVTCPDCGESYEVAKINPIKLREAETEGEDWGE